MTAKDQRLIRRAMLLNSTDWGKADQLAEQADTIEARRELEKIASWKYHQEEATAGLI